MRRAAAIAGAVAAQPLDGGMAVFNGVPYAAPPLGYGRWRPPPAAPPVPAAANTSR